jgi:hypothetical protein
MPTVTDKLTTAIRAAMNDLQKRLIAELQAQGHRLTGALEKSIQYEVKVEGDTITAVMTALRLRFGNGVWRTSQAGYHTAKAAAEHQNTFRDLSGFSPLRGLGSREALSAAFATAKKHKREGMPSRGSYAFSSNGRRTGFVKNTLEQYLPLLTDLIGTESGRVVDLIIGDDIRLEPYKIAA